MNHDVIFLNQFEDKVELYCNCFLFGFNTLEYYHIDDSHSVIKKKLSSEYVTIDNLTSGKYRFYCVNDNGEHSKSIKINIFNDSLADMWNVILDGTGNEKINTVLNNAANLSLSDDYLINLYKLYLNNRAEELKETYEYIINSYVDYRNLLNNQINGQDDLFVKVNKKHVFDITLDEEDPFFESDISVEIFELADKNWEQLNLFEIKSFAIRKRLPSNIYNIFLRKNGCVFRQYYYFSEGEEYDKNKFVDIVSNNEKIDNIRYKNSTMLASEYNLLSDDKMLVISALDQFNNGFSPLFKRPNILVDEDIINIVIDDSLIDFMQYNNSKYYLCAQIEDGIYDEKIKPKRILIESKEFYIEIGKDAFFYPERYYFYISDQNGNKLSNANVYDFSEIVEVDEYNLLYDNILINQFVKKMSSVISENDAEYWPTIKLVLDSFISGDNVKSSDFKEYLIKNTQNIQPSLIHLVWLCYYKFYTKKDRNFLKYQMFKNNYNEHIFSDVELYKKEPYIIKVETIKNGLITTKFVNDVSVKIPNECISIFTPIRIRDMTCGDFVMYYEQNGRKQSWFNSLEVETIYGL